MDGIRIVFDGTGLCRNGIGWYRVVLGLLYGWYKGLLQLGLPRTHGNDISSTSGA